MARRKSNQDKRKKEEMRLAKQYAKKETNIDSKWFIIIGTVLVFVLFYFLTIYITNKNNPKKNTDNKDNTTNIGETIIGRSFDIKSGEYLVFYYDSSNEDIADECKSVFTNYYNRHGEGSIYYVDMNSGFNKAFATTEESNKSPQNASELKINGPTLIKISNNSLVEYIEGLETIEEYLK